MAILVAWVAMQRSQRGRIVWTACIATLLLLAIEQQFAIFSSVTNVIREIALAQHWYGDRRIVQRDVAIGLGAGGLLVGCALLIGLRREPWSLRVAGFATIGLFALALIKAVSLHGLDRLFMGHLPGLPLTLGASLELTGIALVLAAGLVGAATPQRRAFA